MEHVWRARQNRLWIAGDKFSLNEQQVPRMLHSLSFILILVFASLTLGAPRNLNEGENSGSGRYEAKSTDSNDDREEEINLSEVMASCNESFRIRFDYMQEFNNSGSLPDETDKTPMCFMRCVLEKANILNDGVLCKSKVTDLLWPATGNSIEACQAEGDQEQHPCQKAYAIARCMMTRALVDAKNKTE